MMWRTRAYSASAALMAGICFIFVLGIFVPESVSPIHLSVTIGQEPIDGNWRALAGLIAFCLGIFLLWDIERQWQRAFQGA